MGGHKQKKKTNFKQVTQEAYVFSNCSVPARNMRKTDLGSVIFGCKNSTISECLSNKLFGLPEGHFSYIRNISQGLVLFLFNYSDRTLHGIFEAAGPGQMNIDRYAWVADGDDIGYTNYPAQVRICVRQECQPLSEKQFGPVIADNYYESKHFYFELDHVQTKQLISLFRLNPVNKEMHPRIPTRLNLDQTATLSYTSDLGKNSTTTTATSSSHPTRQWSSLFKTLSSVDEQSGIQDSNLSFSASDAPDEDKAEILQEYTWDEEARIWNGQAGTCDGQEDTWNEQSDIWGEQINTMLEPQANTWEEQPNTCDESQPVATADEVTCFQHITTTTAESVQTTDSTGKPLDMPSSSTQPSKEHLDCNASVSDETDDSDTESDTKENEFYEKDNCIEPDLVEEQQASNDLRSTVVKLMQEVKELKGSQIKQIVKINMLKQELVESKQEIDQLRTRLSFLVSQSGSIVDPADVDTQLLNKSQSKLVDSVYIVGGFDGSTWLSTLDSYFPSQDHKCSHSPMNFVKTYASAATLNGEIFHFGGGGSRTVESFNITMNRWTSRPPLHWKNLYAAGASINDRLFVVGGVNESSGSSEVEYLDLNIGTWLPTREMQSKRLASAVAELNNALYVTGGCDGASYLSSVERFDPREEAWYNLPSMNTKKGCHSMVVVDKKLYSLGGFDGDNYVANVECFDTRMGSWVEAEPMNVSRGSFGAFVMGEKLYAIGGTTENNELLDTVECYNEGSRWETVELKAIGKRSHFAAIVM